MATNFHGSTRVKQWLKDKAGERSIALIFIGAMCQQENLVEWAAALSTADAQEMQKGSGQWSVAGSCG